jgi:type IV secretion system protein VirB10
VARRAGNKSLWLFAATLAAVAGGLFYSLQINRLENPQAGLIDPQPAANVVIQSPAALAIPQSTLRTDGAYSMAQFTTGPDRSAYTVEYPTRATAPLTSRFSRPPTAMRQAGKPVPTSQSLPTYAPVFGPPSAGNPIYQTPDAPSAQPMQGGSSAKANEERAAASRLANPSTTVPQGSVIQAVMETALDSTRAGFARAIVSHDVMSYDGTKLLIPRGSKLFGEYKADLSLGDKRALIQWRRLTRPDATIIDLDSPSADPLGRAGVKGKVNTHFFERFGGVILQSVLDLGIRAATVKATGDTIVFGIPTTTQSAVVQQPGEVRPTLRVRQGTSISVFVARDLDFSAVE